MTGMVRRRGVTATCFLLALHVALAFDVPMALPAVGPTVHPSECRSLMDLFMVIDGSDSIDKQDFVKLQTAIDNLIHQLDVGPHKSRVGMLVFSTDVRSEHPFNDNLAQLTHFTYTLEHPRDGTNTSLGLEHMIRMFDTRGRTDVPWVSIVLTDGISKNAAHTAAQAAIAAKRGISVFAVGIGRRISLEELSVIASSPKQVLTIDNFDQLSQELLSMMTKICPCPIPPVLPLANCGDGTRAIGSVRNYQCLDGYLQRGNGVITCQDDFTWTTLSPDFQCVPCSTTPPLVPHGVCGGGDNLLGSRRLYSCLDGYLAVGNPEIMCQNDAQWSIPDFKCIPCGEVPTIPHATCGGGDYTIGSIRKFSCNAGYMAVGFPDIRCQDNAQWTVPDFRCVACSEPPVKPHATCGGVDLTIGSMRSYSCMPGYLAVGSPEIRCLANAEWSSTDFHCVGCGTVPTIDHGTCGGGDSTIGAERIFVCEPGYMAVGNPVITCNPLAKWTLPDFKCVPCGEPPVIKHGMCGIGEYTIGAERTFFCEAGYLAVGNPIITCEANAQWTIPNFECVPCGPTPTIDNGFCGDGELTIGSSRTFSCLPGYLPVGNPIITCGADAKWTSPMFQCVPCGEPPVIPNGVCGGGEIIIGSKRNYVCNDGYLLVGNPVITCDTNAQWTVPHLKCIQCGDVPTISNGECGGGTNTIGSFRKFSCFPGYIAVGKPDIECLADATWSTANFECIPCRETPKITHATCSSGSSTIGSIRTYTCEPGYLAVGTNPSIECLDTADWTVPDFRCVSCGTAPLIDNGFCDGSIDTIGAIRQFQCNPGYLAVGNPNIECMADATWGPHNFQCVPCGPVPTIPNAVCNDGDIIIGARREFRCEPGYMAVGSPFITCGADAMWSHSSFKCVPCIEPPVIPHGSCTGGDLIIGTRRMYMCDDGYLGVGDPYIECRADASWSLLNFQCKACGEVPVVANGYCEGGLNTIGTMRKFACEPGYKAVGIPDITCQGDATWSRSDFKCVPCGDTPLMQYATCGGGDVIIGSKRSYTCDTGYALIGNSEIECLPDATWSVPDFTCSVCAEPPTLMNGECGGGEVFVGSRRTFTCNSGYIPRGNPEITCLGTAKWSTPEFECFDCGDPPVIPHAYCGLGPATVGATREFFCDEGYEMQGRGQLMCLSSGIWEQPSFTCQVKTTPPPVFTTDSICDACRFINGVGYNRHPFDCNQYVQCFMGRRGMEPVYRRCPFGQFWDQNVLTCRPSNLVDCSTDQCKGLLSGSYKHTDPNSCCSYWKCDQGRAYGECCGEGYSYNQALGYCIPDETCETDCEFDDDLPVCDKRPSNLDTMFEQHIGNNIWVPMPCAPGTAYNPVDCDCSLMIMRIPGKTRQQVCKPELYLPFTSSFGDLSGKNVYVHPDNVNIMNGAAYFNGSSRILINRFANTEFHGDLVIKFRYNENKHTPYFNQLQALVTNGDCGADPSVVIAKMPGYVLLGAKTDVPKSFALPTLDKEWKEVIYLHNEKKLEGRVCGASMSKWSYGPIAATHCAIQIGQGTGLQSFYGLIDDLHIYQCRPRAAQLNIDY